MTSSISLAPSTSQLAEASPLTRTTTKSSFPEIDLVSKPPRSSTPHSLIPLQLQIHRATEPFVSPLTETNLNYHKSSFSSSRDAKSKYVDSFIYNQRMLLEQEQELQRQTKVEIRSMIPLDTNSIEEELVRDDFQRQQRLSTSSIYCTTQRHRRHSTLTYSWFSNNDDLEQSYLTDDDDRHSTLQMASGSNKPQRKNSTRHWKRAFTRWIRSGNDKKQTKNNEEHQMVMEATSVCTPPQNTGTSDESSIQPGHDQNANHLPKSRHNNERQARKPSRHVSWSVGTSYEEYKRQKAAMMEQGLYGLSNANIARALGGSHRGSKAPLLFQPELAAPSSQEDNPLTSPLSPCLHIAPSESQTLVFSSTKKKDSGLSFIQQRLSSTKTLLRSRKSTRQNASPKDVTQSTLNDNNDTTDDCDTALEHSAPTNDAEDRTVNTIPEDRGNLSQQQRSVNYSQRRRSTHIMDRYSPRLSALEEEDIAGIVGPTLVAFRYPKMVRMKDLRDAAIHILSAPEDDGNDIGASGDGYNCGEKHKERYRSGHRGGYEGDVSNSKDNNSRIG